MSKVRSTSVSRIVTVEEAKKWLENNKYVYQRKIREKDVRDYQREMESGEFGVATAIEFAVNLRTGDTVLINGQHRLIAMIRAGIPQEFSIVRINYETDEELAHLYATRDIGIVRTPAQAMTAYGIPAQLGLNEWQTKVAIAATKMIYGGFIQVTGTLRRDSDLAKEILKYRIGIDKYFELPTSQVSTQTFRLIRRAPVAALGIVLFQFATHVYGDEKVEKFWDGALYGNNIDMGDPRKVAYIHLTTKNLRARDNQGINVTPEVQVRTLIHCWNAYSENRAISRTQVYGKSTGPVSINGTPWRGK